MVNQMLYQATSPLFKASLETWSKFVAGKITASEGVLKGQIKFEGQFSAIAPYSLAFNELSEILRPIVQAC